jgi:hypothetical protein
VGAREYIDKTYSIKALSAGLAGGVLVRAAQADRYVAAANYLTLSINKVATVYVCYDPRAIALPVWFDATWTFSAETISTTDTGSSPMLVLSKQFPIGQFTLGGDYQGANTGALANYFVIVK